MLSIFSTVILGAIIWLIVYLISIFKPNEQNTAANANLLPEIVEQNEEPELNQLSEECDDINKTIAENLDNDLQEVCEQEIIVEKVNETNREFNENDVEVIHKELIQLFENKDEDNNVDTNLDIRSPNDRQQEVCEEVIIVREVGESESSLEFGLNLSEPIQNDNSLSAGDTSDAETNIITDFFQDDDDSQGLVHINKSRPKKPKSRPSVKSVFSSESTELSQESHESFVDSVLTSDSENTVIISSTRFVETTEYSETKFSSHFAEVVISGDNSGDAISNSVLDYKNIDVEAIQRMGSHDDSDANERKKQELSGFVGQIVDQAVAQLTTSNQDINETEIVDLLFTDIITENESESVTGFGDDDEINEETSFEKVVETTNRETVRLSSIVRSESSDLSPLSATIESVVKPLFVKKCLANKSISDNEPNNDNCDVNEHINNDHEDDISDRIKRVSRPVFGSNQSSLISEMREKQFQKSLKNQNVDQCTRDSTGDINSDIKS